MKNQTLKTIAFALVLAVVHTLFASLTSGIIIFVVAVVGLNGPKIVALSGRHKVNILREATRLWDGFKVTFAVSIVSLAIVLALSLPILVPHPIVRVVFFVNLIGVCWFIGRALENGIEPEISLNVQDDERYTLRTPESELRKMDVKPSIMGKPMTVSEFEAAKQRAVFPPVSESPIRMGEAQRPDILVTDTPSVVIVPPAPLASRRRAKASPAPEVLPVGKRGKVLSMEPAAIRMRAMRERRAEAAAQELRKEQRAKAKRKAARKARKG